MNTLQNIISNDGCLIDCTYHPVGELDEQSLIQFQVTLNLGHLNFFRIIDIIFQRTKQTPQCTFLLLVFILFDTGDRFIKWYKRTSVPAKSCLLLILIMDGKLSSFTSTCYRKHKFVRIIKTNKLCMHLFSNSVFPSLIKTKF